MRYMLQKDNVIYIIPGKKGFRINCLKGKAWLTIKADVKDYILGDGDSLVLEKCDKAAVMAFADSSLMLEGCKFHLHELKSVNSKFRVNKIRIRQAGYHYFDRARILYRIMHRSFWGQPIKL